MSKKDKKSQKTSETARRIWLAGVGAYGRAFTEAQEAFKEVTGRSSEVFDDLVQKGEMIEMGLNKKSKDWVEKSGLGDFDLEDRISKMRSRLRRSDDAADDLEHMESRLDALESKLDRVLTALEGKTKPAAKKPAARKPASKKAPVKKAATKRTTTTRKTAAKKPAAKKPAAKKAAPKK